MLDRTSAEQVRNAAEESWELLFERGISQSLIKQYTNAVNTYTDAIRLNPGNPFLYMNRATTRAEMIDFISSIDNSYQRITVDSDPAKRLNNAGTRSYSYDEAIEDMNKAIKAISRLRIRLLQPAPILWPYRDVCPRPTTTTLRP